MAKRGASWLQSDWLLKSGWKVGKVKLGMFAEHGKFQKGGLAELAAHMKNFK